ncbi:TonB-dependent siderophore receptor [Paracoccus sp. NGMCC 1.201697]|uniref:TonB-dependent siderophore receptor n=1 Tax=Paracoccus broussonetiae subsp. drimophilus TaxID=3373869 RepID=A0ABW7LMC5_9RHOB
MSQALRYTAGVTAEPFGAKPRFDLSILPGFNASDSHYPNGLHLIRKFGARAYELYGRKRIEVLRGPVSKDPQLSPAGSPFALTKIGNTDGLCELHAGYPDTDNSDRRMLNHEIGCKRGPDNGRQFRQRVWYEEFDWDNVAVPRGIWYTKIENLTIEQTGIYGQDEIARNSWRATFALRHDWSRQTRDVLAKFLRVGNANDAYQRDEATTGRVGPSYVFNSGVAPYISYSASFEPEIGTDSVGSVFGPTASEQWEAGEECQPPAFDALFNAAVYDQKQSNLVRTIDGFPEQVGEVHSKGVELEAIAELSEGWDVLAACALTHACQKGEAVEGLRMSNTPYNAPSLWPNDEFGNGYRAVGCLRYIGERYGDLNILFKVDAVTLGDLAASYTHGTFEASVNPFGITEEEYIASYRSFGCHYAEVARFRRG